jgi:two-component system OmpR family response regulator
MSPRKLIAVVEDEALLRENYLDTLMREGYLSVGYANRMEAEEAFKNQLPDLVIIDIGLGNEPRGGIDLCRNLRVSFPALPIIFLTAKDSEFDKLRGYDSGADDYLVKPISNDHLLVRVNSLLRRVDALRTTEEKVELVEVGFLRLDLDRMIASWKGNIISFTVTEFWIVHALVKRPGWVKKRVQLLKDSRQTEHISEDSVTSQVKRIRKKFLEVDPKFKAIHAVYGTGYRWLSDESTPKN